MRFRLLAAAAVVLVSGFAAAETASPPGAREYFINLKNGQHVKSPVLVQFGLSGMGVAPAGSTNANTGHHHLIIDADTPPAGMPIAMDEKHRHFGGGQTEISVPLCRATTRSSSCSPTARTFRTIRPSSRRKSRSRSTRRHYRARGDTPLPSASALLAQRADTFPDKGEG